MSLMFTFNGVAVTDDEYTAANLPTRSEQQAFAYTMWFLMRIGTPILEVMKLLFERIENAKLRYVIYHVTKELRASGELGPAISRHDDLLDEDLIELFRRSEDNFDMKDMTEDELAEALMNSDTPALDDVLREWVLGQAGAGAAFRKLLKLPNGFAEFCLRLSTALRDEGRLKAALARAIQQAPEDFREQFAAPLAAALAKQKTLANAFRSVPPFSDEVVVCVVEFAEAADCLPQFFDEMANP